MSALLLEPYTKEWVFQAWTPEESIWSKWAKPVLFASMYVSPPKPGPIEVDLSWMRAGDPSVAYVLDLPGSSAVWAAPGLIERGLHPVPLYNALASAVGYIPSSEEEVPRVDVAPIVGALWHLAADIEQSRISPGAPPAFLLDSNRATGKADLQPGDFDNRSVSFPTDFPSANLLLSRNINRVVVVQMTRAQPQQDLAHTLRRWQEAGIRIDLKAMNSTEPPAPLIVEKPSQFKSMWYELLVRLGFQTSNRLGGFGKVISENAMVG